MSDFKLFTNAAPMIHSAGAAASLSMADANFDGVKHHDTNKVDATNRLITVVISVLAVGCLFSGLFAMWIEASVVAYVAFAFSVVTAPAVITQRRKIQWLPTFVDECNKLRLTVGDFAMERTRLTNENNRLERQVQRMQAVMTRFEQVAKRDGRNVEECKNLVRSNGEIQREIKKLQASADLVDLFTVIMNADRNEDNKVSEEELERFMLRVRIFATRSGKPLNEDLLREAFKQSMTKTNVSLFNITASMMEDDKVDESGAVLVDVEAPTAEPPAVVDESEVDEDGFVQLRKLPSTNEETVSDVPTTAKLSKEEAPNAASSNVASFDGKVLDRLVSSSSSDHNSESVKAEVKETFSAEMLLDSILSSFSGETKPEQKKSEEEATAANVV